MKKLMHCSVSLLVVLLTSLVMASPKPPSADHELAQTRASAIFAGGCFWCMEPPFDKLDGVLETISGYSGGKSENPTYKQVSAGGTGHYEVIKVVYDPEKVNYQKLLEIFWRNVDPLDSEGQFCDKGQHYLSAIFVDDETQRAQAKASLKAIQQKLVKRLDRPATDVKVATRILAEAAFYPAEEYHQDYYQKNPLRYRFYRTRCGRDARLAELWD